MDDREQRRVRSTHREHSKKKKRRKEEKRSKHKRHDRDRHRSDTSSSDEAGDRASAAIDLDDDALWVEREPTSTAPAAVEAKATVTSLQRPSWMLDAPDDLEGFSSARPREPTPPPAKADFNDLKVSDRELNVHLKSGMPLDQYPEQPVRQIEFGDAGSNWRMLKLKRTLELAEETQRPLEEVALERYSSADDFLQAKEERAWLDARGNIRGSSKRGHERSAPTGAFRRPRAASDSDDDDALRSHRRKPRYEARAPVSTDRQHTVPLRAEKAPERAAPVRSVPLTSTAAAVLAAPIKESCMTQNELNKLKAQALRARMMGMSNADELEAKYEQEKSKVDAAGGPAQEATKRDNVVLLTEAELRGRRIGPDAEETARPSRSKQDRADTHDAGGARIRYGHTGEDASLSELVREERAGTSADYNHTMLRGISRDARYQDDLEYMDEQAERLAAHRPQTSQQVRRDAINNYQRSQRALDRCNFCFKDGHAPAAPLISLGHHVYLALPATEPLTPGHCLIVPIRHQLSMLECEDDVWTEVRNFMKCLLQMFHADGRRCLFQETVMNISWHRHTVIECIPMPEEQAADAPAYFKASGDGTDSLVEAILAADDEWTQHRKLYDTREKGFRSTMTAQLPYFHVWFTLDGGYGHIIENADRFPGYFGQEIIGGMLDLMPQMWRKPRRLHGQAVRERITAFKKEWSGFDWTRALTQASET